MGYGTCTTSSFTFSMSCTTATVTSFTVGTVTSSLGTEALVRLSEAKAEAGRRAAYETTQARRLAEGKALCLLHSLLDDNQKAQLESEDAFTVDIVTRTGEQRRYKIKRGHAANVYRLDKSGKPIERLCAHPEEYVPDEDTMAAQLMMLQSCEEEFRAMANFHAVH